nr:ATP-dependent helicase C-terminal domain-containing protein [Desulfobulbus rhabdoformis]
MFGLQAIDAKGHITEHGRKLAQLPLHPRLAQMLVQAREMGVESLGCDLAALLAERDPMPGAASSDISERLELLELFRNRGKSAVRQKGGDPAVVRRIDQAARVWRRSPAQPLENQEAALGSLLLAAFPERIAQKRHDARHRYQLASGRGARLSPTDPLCGSAYIIAAQLDSGHKEGCIYLAAALEKATILDEHAHLVTETQEVRWDTASSKVLATTRRAIGALLVDEHPLPAVSEEAITNALLEGVTQTGVEALPWTPRARQLQARIHCLRLWQQQEQWPGLDDATLITDLSWLAPYLGGMRQLTQVQSLDLYFLLHSRLDWPQQQRLKQLVPETITVPSGSTIRIDYRLEGPPVLAVRLQEMFGQKTTPTICNQQIPLLLHLLSPARRPIQVTDDLASFWQNGYPQVKKELKGRYPKHAWPDDPIQAKALRGVPRKK